MSKAYTLDEAEILAKLAEAEKYTEEAAFFRADRAFKDEEARQKRAEADAAEYSSVIVRINHDAALRQEKVVLAANHHHNEYEFWASVYDEPVSSCIAQMKIWHRNDPECPMNIVMDSPGGSVIDGMHLFDDILRYSKRPWDDGVIKAPRGLHDTTMTVRGYAASMAGILLQAADRRVMGPEAFLMIHEVSSFAGGKIGEIKDEVDFLDKVSDRVTNIFVRRSGGKITAEEFKVNWDRRDWWLTSEEALTYGFVDEIG